MPPPVLLPPDLPPTFFGILDIDVVRSRASAERRDVRRAALDVDDDEAVFEAAAFEAAVQTNGADGANEPDEAEEDGTAETVAAATVGAAAAAAGGTAPTSSDWRLRPLDIEPPAAGGASRNPTGGEPLSMVPPAPLLLLLDWRDRMSSFGVVGMVLLLLLLLLFALVVTSSYVASCYCNHQCSRMPLRSEWERKKPSLPSTSIVAPKGIVGLAARRGVTRQAKFPHFSACSAYAFRLLVPKSQKMRREIGCGKKYEGSISEAQR